MDLLLRLLSLFFRGTALMLGVVGTGFALVCLGGVFSDRLDAFSHLSPLWLAMATGAVVTGWIFARGDERKAIVGLGSLGLLACAILMGPELMAAAGSKRLAARPGDLKIIQFNVWHENETPELALRWLLDQDADVVVIVEGGGMAASVTQGLKAYYPFHVTCDGKRYCGTMIFSRKRMLARNGFYPEGHELAGAWATLADPKGAFTVAGIHYVWPIPAGPQQQQGKRLLAAMDRFDRSTTILTGDFNSTPWSFTLKRQDKALGLERRTRALPSWPSGRFSRLANAPAPFLPIDHVYAGKAWKTVSVTRGPALGSDHRPIVVHLRRD
ncbi:endonuclease/exonuclease/phosphatase family protein [Caulobacter henricii]|uniref:Endonuclease n=1 Tax=Caulobacter henricii TaxID=69395 RepID=A0A0P0NYS5_9CAUL|nr:endonuclease/exonuclease/phosphatase family protein [Caulobacter henricii]ALL13264.1 endonuclease [Caulobacter henricii]